MRWISVIAIAFCLAGPLGAEEQDLSKLTLDRLYDSKDFESKSYSATWLDGEEAYTRVEESAIVRVDARTGVAQTLVSAAELTPAGSSKPLTVNGYSFSDDLSLVLIYTNSQRVWRQKTRGDYWILDRSARQLRQLGGNAAEATLMFAKLSPDSRHVAYVREGDLYMEDVAGEVLRRLTRKRTATEINGTFDWVYEEELRLRDGWRWSPDGKSIAYWQLDTQGVGRIPLVNNTDSLYPQVQWIPYPKVGEQNSSARVGVMRLESGETTWMQAQGDPRNQYIARMEWAENSDEIVMQLLNRRQNENRVLLGDAGTGEVRTILTETDDAWVDVLDPVLWLDDGEKFSWLSDRDGWRHLYVASREGGEPELVTKGEFDVIQLLHVDDDSATGWAYFIASPGDAQRRYLHRARLDGSKLERVTPKDAPGTHSYRMSDGGGFAVHTYATANRPPVTDLVSLPDHKRVRMLEDNEKLHEAYAALETTTTEFFKIEIEDGVELDAYSIEPPNMDRTKKYPVLVYVYGEPAGQTVLDNWGSRSGLWHRMMAQQGYVVVSIDNRGTAAPRGRAFRKSAYRRIGRIGPADQAAALRRLLAEREYLDADRVGVWGWSGGGSSTLHALFKHPDLYHVGISVAPVPNQRYYDTIYQERYMDLPADNVEGFVEGSPINFAHQLEGELLLVHGTGDDNCHYQTTEMLINELIRQKKPFTMMPYPNRSHSINEGETTTFHLRSMMTRFLNEKLPAGPR